METRRLIFGGCIPVFILAGVACLLMSLRMDLLVTSVNPGGFIDEFFRNTFFGAGFYRYASGLCVLLAAALGVCEAYLQWEERSGRSQRRISDVQVAQLYLGGTVLLVGVLALSIAGFVSDALSVSLQMQERASSILNGQARRGGPSARAAWAPARRKGQPTTR